MKTALENPKTGEKYESLKDCAEKTGTDYEHLLSLNRRGQLWRVWSEPEERHQPDGFCFCRTDMPLRIDGKLYMNVFHASQEIDVAPERIIELIDRGRVHELLKGYRTGAGWFATAEEAAEELQISVSTVKRRLKDGTLYLTMGKGYRRGKHSP